MSHPSWRRGIPVVTLLAAIPAVAVTQDVTTEGTLTAIWGDPPAESTAPPTLHWYLFNHQGDVLAVEIPDAVLRNAGGVRALDRRRVAATGPLTRRPDLGPPGDRTPSVPVLRASGLRAVGPAPAASIGAADRSGSTPFAVLLCRFADGEEEHQPPSFFEALMGGGYPNMDHYYRALSAGQMDLGGTEVFGWYEMGEPRSRYLDVATGIIALYDMASDCIAAAGPGLELGAFAGIIAQFDAQFSESGLGQAFGGSMVLALDGESRVWPFAWMPRWAMDQSRYGVYAHEIGHALGLPHSSGASAYTYDSAWDVMSRPYLTWEPAVNAWVPGETIAFHKDLLGWIPPDRKVTLAEADRVRVRLEPHSAAAGGADVLLVRIPIPGVAAFYTVEARRRVGYDGGLPRSTVLIHRVPEPGGPDCSPYRCAEVVDRSGTGNPNGSGATWSPGDTFDDGAGVTVAVTGATQTGWQLEVTVVVPPPPPGLTMARAADALAGGPPLTAEEVEYLDEMGNRNGWYDLGDFLAFVMRERRND